MPTTDMNAAAAEAIRTELNAIGTSKSSLQRRQRRGRGIAALVGIVAIAGATTGAAIAVNGLPGSTTTSPLGTVTTATGTGPAFIDLGPAPKLAGSVLVSITCLNDVGTVLVETTTVGGAGGPVCSLGRTDPVVITDGALPPAGSTKISIQSSPNTKWKVTAQYASSTTKKWGVNAHGQTFGVSSNKDGHPDLTYVTATNGKKGYYLTKAFDEFEGSGSLDVFESDGTTVIGHLDITTVPNLPESDVIVPDQVESPVATPAP